MINSYLSQMFNQLSRSSGTIKLTPGDDTSPSPKSSGVIPQKPADAKQTYQGVHINPRTGEIIRPWNFEQAQRLGSEWKQTTPTYNQLVEAYGVIPGSGGQIDFERKYNPKKTGFALSSVENSIIKDIRADIQQQNALSGEKIAKLADKYDSRILAKTLRNSGYNVTSNDITQTQIAVKYGSLARAIASGVDRDTLSQFSPSEVSKASDFVNSLSPSERQILKTEGFEGLQQYVDVAQRNQESDVRDQESAIQRLESLGMTEKKGPDGSTQIQYDPVALSEAAKSDIQIARDIRLVFGEGARDIFSEMSSVQQKRESQESALERLKSFGVTETQDSQGNVLLQYDPAVLEKADSKDILAVFQKNAGAVFANISEAKNQRIAQSLSEGIALEKQSVLNKLNTPRYKPLMPYTGPESLLKQDTTPPSYNLATYAFDQLNSGAPEQQLRSELSKVFHPGVVISSINKAKRAILNIGEVESAIQNAGPVEDAKMLSLERAIDAVAPNTMREAGSSSADVINVGGYTSIIYRDESGNPITSEAGRWSTLTPDQKALVAQIWVEDPYKKNYFTAVTREMQIAAEEGGLVGQMAFAPITGITGPIAKKVTGQKVTPIEWVGAGATAAMDVAMLGPIAGLSSPIIKGAEAATIGGFGAVYANKWNTMSNMERAVFGSLLVVPLAAQVGARTGIVRVAPGNLLDAAQKSGQKWEAAESLSRQAGNEALLSPKLASELQIALAESRMADQRLFDLINHQSSLSKRSMQSLERESGITGLYEARDAILKAQNNIDDIWSGMERRGLSPDEVSAEMSIARQKYADAITNYNSLFVPRATSKSSQSSLMDAYANEIDARLDASRMELARLESGIPELLLKSQRDISAQSKNLRKEITYYESLQNQIKQLREIRAEPPNLQGPISGYRMNLEGGKEPPQEPGKPGLPSGGSSKDAYYLWKSKVDTEPNAWTVPDVQRQVSTVLRDLETKGPTNLGAVELSAIYRSLPQDIKESLSFPRIDAALSDKLAHTAALPGMNPVILTTPIQQLVVPAEIIESMSPQSIRNTFGKHVSITGLTGIVKTMPLTKTQYKELIKQGLTDAEIEDAIDQAGEDILLFWDIIQSLLDKRKKSYSQLDKQLKDLEIAEREKRLREADAQLELMTTKSPSRQFLETPEEMVIAISPGYMITPSSITSEHPLLQERLLEQLKRSALPIERTKPLTYTQLQELTKPQTQPLAETKTKPQTRPWPQTRPQTQTLTQPKTQPLTQILTETQPQTNSISRTTAETPIPPDEIPPSLSARFPSASLKPLPVDLDEPHIVSAEGIPANPGETIWKQGISWIAAAPPSPDNIQKGKRGQVKVTIEAPDDAPRKNGTPQQTLYSRGIPPEKMVVDVGFERATVTKGRKISFGIESKYMIRSGNKVKAHHESEVMKRRRR